MLYYGCGWAVAITINYAPHHITVFTLSQKILQNFSDSPSHRIFKYEVLNKDKK
jgi:hypothetical protein